MGELFVSLCVMSKGGQVLRNLSPSGAVDLAIRFGSILIPIDVKVASWGVGGRAGKKSWQANISKVPEYVFPVIVLPEGGTDFQQWQVRWAHASFNNKSGKFRCPPGMEDFWTKNFKLQFH